MKSLLIERAVLLIFILIKVAELKKRIESQSRHTDHWPEFKAENQCLIFNGRVLQNDEILGSVQYFDFESVVLLPNINTLQQAINQAEDRTQQNAWSHQLEQNGELVIEDRSVLYRLDVGTDPTDPEYQIARDLIQKNFDAYGLLRSIVSYRSLRRKLHVPSRSEHQEQHQYRMKTCA